LGRKTTKITLEKRMTLRKRKRNKQQNIERGHWKREMYNDEKNLKNSESLLMINYFFI